MRGCAPKASFEVGLMHFDEARKTFHELEAQFFGGELEESEFLDRVDDVQQLAIQIGVGL